MLHNHRRGGHYAFTATVYPDIPGHWGDVNHLDQKKQKCSPENLVGINHSQITFFYSENPTKNGQKGTHLSSTFSKTANLLRERRWYILQEVFIEDEQYQIWSETSKIQTRICWGASAISANSTKD